MPNARLLASDGRVYLGTTQGFNTFYPYQVKINHVVPPVAITSLELFNKHVEVGSEKLPESLNHIEQLDPALIRAGRIDERVELGYADEDQLRRLYLKFHDDPAAAAEFAHQNAGQSRAPAAVQGELMSRLGAKRV